jgi:ubiquinone/menaquinone biosynthesis C-methylase UbiE
MPLFRKRNRQQAAGTSRTRPAAMPTPRPGTPSPDETDWRWFDAVADDYARLFAPHFREVAEDLVKLLEVQHGQRVLDIGTGTGVGARAAALAVSSDGLAAGVDPSVGMLRVARREGDALYAAAATIDLPFRDGTFDRVLGNFVVSFFGNFQTAMFDVMRVLRPGGRLAFSAWAAGDQQDELRKTWRGVAEEFAEHEILEDAQARAVPSEERFSDRSALKQALHDAGLRDIWTEVRDYRFEMTREDWLSGREIVPLGRFLRQMLGEETWETFRRRVRAVFADRFPSRLNDFRQVNLAVGHKP